MGALPHRNLATIKRHFKRKIGIDSGLDMGWNDEQREQLRDLVKEHGRKWSVIGRIMGKLADECRHAYERIRFDPSSGNTTTTKKRYTVRENLRIFKVLRRHFENDVEKILDTPEKDLPWSAIAIELKNKRQPKDYERHWPSFRRYFIRELGSSATLSDVKNRLKSLPKKSCINFYTMKNNFPDEAMLQRLKKYDVADYSGILWGDLERDYNVPPKSLTTRWKYLETFCPENLTHFQEKVDHLLGIVDCFQNKKKPKYNSKCLVNKALEVHLFNRYMRPYLSSGGEIEKCGTTMEVEPRGSLSSSQMVSKADNTTSLSEVSTSMKPSTESRRMLQDDDDDNSDIEWTRNSYRRPNKRHRKT